MSELKMAHNYGQAKSKRDERAFAVKDLTIKEILYKDPDY